MQALGALSRPFWRHADPAVVQVSCCCLLPDVFASECARRQATLNIPLLCRLSCLSASAVRCSCWTPSAAHAATCLLIALFRFYFPSRCRRRRLNHDVSSAPLFPVGCGVPLSHQNMVRTPLICCLLLLDNANAFVIPVGKIRSFVLDVHRLYVRICPACVTCTYVFLLARTVLVRLLRCIQRPDDPSPLPAAAGFCLFAHYGGKFP